MRITILKKKNWEMAQTLYTGGMGRGILMIFAGVFFLCLSPLSGASQGLQRLYPSDPMELYLRSVYPVENGRWDRTVSVWPGIYPGVTTATDTTISHPWQSHSFFTDPVQPGQDTGLFVYGIQPVLLGSYNSEIPMGQNDGALWQGRGYNAAVSGGAGMRYKGITLQLDPTFVYSENREYELTDFRRFGDVSEYAMHLTYADLPMRFGDRSVSDLYLGDSFIEFAARGWKLGVSNERMWSGPAVYNPLLFSNNAPGFLHVFAGTNAPVKSAVGDFRGRIFWGSLKESDYFDEDPGNDRRFLSGFFLSYSPEWIPGLEVGFNKAAYSSYSGIGFDEIILPFKIPQSNADRPAEDARVTMMSVFANWRFKEVNSELYMEWGRNDDKRRLRDLLAEPELNRGYVLGALKRFTLNSRQRLLFNIEATNLENTNVSTYFRDFNIWYTSEAIPQGFTQNGQVLGAGIGPGSSTQKINLSFYDTWGMAAVSMSRIAHHNDRHFQNEDYFRSFARYPQFYFLLDRHEIEKRAEVQVLLFLPYKTELQLNYSRGNIHNRYNIRKNDIVNHHVRVTLRYNIAGFVR